MYLVGRNLLFILFCVMANANDIGKSKQKLIIDNDAGGDDAMAIFVALLGEKYLNGPELVALTTGVGNTLEDNVCLNNQKILKVAQRQDVPIYRGSKSPIFLSNNESLTYYGKDGLGDNDEVITDLVPAKPENAIVKLIELSKEHKENLTIVTIGTLTNIALAIKLDPDFLERIGHLYVAAGHIHDEEINSAEFNAYSDPEAYHIVAQNANPHKVTLLPYSQVKIHLDFTKAWREDVLGAINTDIMRAQNKFERVALGRPGDRWQSLDPAMISVIVKPELIDEYMYSKNDILLHGADRGKNTNTLVAKEDANVRVIYSIKHESYQKFLLQVFSAEILDTVHE